jgi:hypothetical protein
MRILARLVIAALFVPALVATPAAAQAAGTTSTPLPVDRADTLVFDPGSEHLYLSTGPGRSEVLVTDAAGTVVQRLSGLPGASGLVLDAGVVYVALHDAGAIAAFDTGTLAESQRWSLPADVCPDRLAVTAGRLVFTATNCGEVFVNGWVGTLDRATGSVTLSQPNTQHTPSLAANPASNGLAAVADSYSSPAAVVLYDVRGAAPAEVNANGNLTGIADLAMAPDGRSVFVSTGSGGYLVPLDTLAFGRSVTSSSVAGWSGDGGRLVIGSGELLTVWPAGATATSSGLRGPFDTVARRGRLAVDPAAARAWVVSAEFLQNPVLVRYDLTPTGTRWSLSGSRIELPAFTPGTLRADLFVGGQPVADGVRLVVLVDQVDGTTTSEVHFTSGGGITLSLFPYPGVTRYRFSHLDDAGGYALAYADVIGVYQTVLAPVFEPFSPVNPEQSLTWYVQLTDASGVTLSGRRVELTRRDGDADTLLDYRFTDQSGNATLQTVAGDPGTYTYTVRYPGDEAAAPARFQTVIAVEKFTGSVAVQAELGTGKTRRTATVTGYLGSWHTNRVLTITATPDGGTPTVIGQGEVGEANTLTVQYQMRSATTFTVSYAGDDWYTPAQESVRLTLR